MASSSLFKERDKFLKRQAESTALMASSSSASSEKRAKVGKTGTSQKNGRSKPAFGRSKTSSDFANDYRAPKPSNTPTPRLRQLYDIVEFLKLRFLTEPDSEPLTLDEIEKECKDLSLDSHTKYWLAAEALLSNPKIDVKSIDNVNKFHYKPPLEVRGAKGQLQALLNLLKARHEKCEGAITVDDVRDSMLKADTFIKKLKDRGDIIMFTGSNKKEVLFYNDRAYDLRVNPEFIQSWRTFSVEGLSDEDIHKYLDNHGHFGLTKHITPRMPLPARASRRRQRGVEAMKHNQHIAHQLEIYTDMSGKK